MGSAGAISSAAQLRAEELVEKFSHTRPDGTICSTVFDGMEGYSYRGENIAKGQKTPEEVVKDWMESTGHRENILQDQMDYIGVGCVQKNGTFYWVQLFGDDAKTTGRPGDSSGQTTNPWDLENYVPIDPMTKEEAEKSDHCMLFLDSESGSLFRYSPHNSPTFELRDPKNGFLYRCESCSKKPGIPMYYLCKDGQVYRWNQ